MEEIILNIEGMHCEGCENRIKNAVMEITGVEKVVANHSNGTVKITLNTDVNRKVIAETIEDIGFEVKGE